MRGIADQIRLWLRRFEMVFPLYSLTDLSTEPRPRPELTLSGGTVGTGLTSSVDLLAEVVPSRPVVTDVVLSVQARQAGVAASHHVAAPNVPGQGGSLSEGFI